MGLFIIVLCGMFALLIVCVGGEVRRVCVSHGGDMLISDGG